MSGDNHRQAERFESIREHCTQSLFAEPQSPGRPHEMDASLYRVWIHLPLPQAGTPCELACLA
jgi:hypothetical protein